MSFLAYLLKPEAAGRVMCPVSKRIYSMNSSGTLRRVSPERPWRGKAERRRVIAIRRLNRQAKATLAS